MLKSTDYECGYVDVRDDFGDYGTVGFYALHKDTDTLLHFLFSCRTIGQGVEQYVYASLGHPQLATVGVVINPVTEAPAPRWINQDTGKGSSSQKDIGGGKILFKGPCELENTLHYIQSSDRIEREFTYVKEGTNRTYFAHNHSAHILDLLLNDEEKREMLEDCAFVDDAMLEGKFFSGEYEWIVLSTFLESDFGVYHKVTNPRIKVVIGGWDKPITNEENRSHYQIKDESQPYYSLSDEEIDRFVSQYVFDGYTYTRDPF